MEIKELLQALRMLSHRDKLRIIQFLAEELKKVEALSSTAPLVEPSPESEDQRAEAMLEDPGYEPSAKQSSTMELSAEDFEAVDMELEESLFASDTAVKVARRWELTGMELGEEEEPTLPHRGGRLSGASLVPQSPMPQEGAADSGSFSAASLHLKPPARVDVTQHEQPAVAEDPIFDEFISELKDEDGILFEVLLRVQQGYWHPLAQVFQALELTGLQEMLESLDLTPIRKGVGALVNELMNGLVELYHDHLEHQLHEAGLRAFQVEELFVSKKKRALLRVELSAPFRKYTDHLKQLELASKAMLDAFPGLPRGQLARLQLPLFSAQTAPLFRPTAKSVEKSWQRLYDALLQRQDSGGVPHVELESLLRVMGQLISQLEHTYNTTLYRILEIWEDLLLKPVDKKIATLG